MGYVSENRMKSDLLKKEYETAMGIPLSGSEAPSVKPVPTIPGKTEMPSPDKPEPYIQIPDPQDKYGRPKTVKNPEYDLWEKEQSKILEFDVKKEQLKRDLDSFFAVDSKIQRAAGGFIPTRAAGIKSRYKAIAQPVDPATGKVSQEAMAARTHDAAVKRLRVQLVRAAGDVGNINITEQEAAEKLIPGFYDADETANLKKAYLREISKAIDSGDPNEVKKVLDKAGVQYFDSGGSDTGSSSAGTSSQLSDDEAWAEYQKISGGRR